jgi:glycerol uptake facilitator-like aquaporin
MSPATYVRSVNGRRAAAEALGTFFLVLIGPGTAMVDAFSHGAVGQVGVALAFAFVVIAMIYALGHLSGAHINPAVTIAFWSVRRFPVSEILPYVAAQCGGAALASAVLAAARVYDFLRRAEPPLARAPERPLGVQGPIEPATTR